MWALDWHVMRKGLLVSRLLFFLYDSGFLADSIGLNVWGSQISSSIMWLLSKSFFSPSLPLYYLLCPFIQKILWEKSTKGGIYNFGKLAENQSSYCWQNTMGQTEPRAKRVNELWVSLASPLHIITSIWMHFVLATVYRIPSSSCNIRIMTFHRLQLCHRVKQLQWH